MKAPKHPFCSSDADRCVASCLGVRSGERPHTWWCLLVGAPAGAFADVHVTARRRPLDVVPHTCAAPCKGVTCMAHTPQHASPTPARFCPSFTAPGRMRQAFVHGGRWSDAIQPAALLVAACHVLGPTASRAAASTAAAAAAATSRDASPPCKGAGGAACGAREEAGAAQC